MRYWTYDEIKTKVQRDIDIEQEDFVSGSELMGYCNEAIDEAEAEIHTLYEDYFLTKEDLDLVSGVEFYSLPTDIYANKIRGVVHRDGELMYTLEKMRYHNRFADLASTKAFNQQGRYRYLLINASALAGVQMQIIPTPRTNLTNGLELWYIRNANRIINNDSLCDIPEFVNFVIQYMKLRVYEKEGHPNTSLAASLLDQQRKQMVSTLTNMIPDGDNEIEKDFSFYEDMA